MRVNKKSWHYRVLMDDFKFRLSSGRLGYSSKITTCTYRSMVLASILARTILGAIATLLASSVVYTVGVLAYSTIWGMPEFTEFTNGVFSLGITIVAGVMFLAGLTGLHTLCSKQRKAKDTQGARVTKEPGFFLQWVKDKKSKYCPIVEFTDE